MITNPTDEHKEQARDRVWLLDDDPDYCNRAPLGRNDTEYIRADTIAARDAEIREVLEGLSTLIHYTHGQPERCWCNNQNSNWTHTQECLAARALYAKLQPGEKKLTGE